MLGPTYWRDDYDPQLPGWLQRYVPNDWEFYGDDRPEPVDVRAALCGWLSEWDIDATIMRMHEDVEGETNIEKFQRIERELTSPSTSSTIPTVPLARAT